MSSNPLLTLAERFRRAALAREAQAASALIRAWGGAWERIRRDAVSLAEQIAAFRKAGQTVTRGQVARLTRYRALIEQMQKEIERLLPFVEETIRQQQSAAIKAALNESKQLARAALPFPDDVNAELIKRWAKVPTAAIESLIGTLENGSPLSSLFENITKGGSSKAADVLTRGLVSGKPIARIAADLRDALGEPMSRTLTIARTEILRSYRNASIQSYRANPGIVKGYRRLEALDKRTCIACVMAHGKFYKLDEPPDFHVNDRGTLVPETATFRDLGINVDEPPKALNEGDGMVWFRSQPEASQRDILGKSTFRAWKDGAITERDFAHTHTDKEWGSSFVPKPLKASLGDIAKKYYARN